MLRRMRLILVVVLALSHVTFCPPRGNPTVLEPVLRASRVSLMWHGTKHAHDICQNSGNDNRDVNRINKEALNQWHARVFTYTMMAAMLTTIRLQTRPA